MILGPDKNIIDRHFFSKAISPFISLSQFLCAYIINLPLISGLSWLLKELIHFNLVSNSLFYPVFFISYILIFYQLNMFRESCFLFVTLLFITLLVSPMSFLYLKHEYKSLIFNSQEEIINKQSLDPYEMKTILDKNNRSYNPDLNMSKYYDKFSKSNFLREVNNYLVNDVKLYKLKEISYCK